jgi:hypothetical protein
MYTGIFCKPGGEEKKKNNNDIFVIAGIALVALLIVGLGLWWWWRNVKSTPASDPNNPPKTMMAGRVNETFDNGEGQKIVHFRNVNNPNSPHAIFEGPQKAVGVTYVSTISGEPWEFITYSMSYIKRQQ